MYTYLQQALPRVVILKYISQVILITGLYQRFLWWIPWSVFLSLIKHLLSSKEEMEVASTVQPYEGEPRRSNEDFDDKSDKNGFSPAVFRSRLEQKIPVTEYLVCCICVLSSMAKSMLRMGSCVRFCYHNIIFLRTTWGEGSPRSVL